MVEMRNVRPRHLGVARRTVRAKLAAVDVLMTRATGCLQTKEGLRLVTRVALQRTVLALQVVSRLVVIKGGHRRRPPHQLKIPTGVFSVTTSAVTVAFRRVDDASMVATVASYALGDLRMTARTLQLRTSNAQAMALGAVQSSFEIFVVF